MYGKFSADESDNRSALSEPCSYSASRYTARDGSDALQTYFTQIDPILRSQGETFDHEGEEDGPGVIYSSVPSMHNDDLSDEKADEGVQYANNYALKPRGSYIRSGSDSEPELEGGLVSLPAENKIAGDDDGKIEEDFCDEQKIEVSLKDTRTSNSSAASIASTESEQPLEVIHRRPADSRSLEVRFLLLMPFSS